MVVVGKVRRPKLPYKWRRAGPARPLALSHTLSGTRCTGRTSLAVLLAYMGCRLWGTQKSHFGLLRLLAHEPSILLSKASTNTLGVLQKLLCAMRHAFGLFGRNGARRKVVDTATEAALH